MSDPSERKLQRPDKSLVVFNHAQIAIHTTILLGRALRLRARNRYESWRLKVADSFVDAAHSAWPRLLTCVQSSNRNLSAPLLLQQLQYHHYFAASKPFFCFGAVVHCARTKLSNQVISYWPCGRSDPFEPLTLHRPPRPIPRQTSGSGQCSQKRSQISLPSPNSLALVRTVLIDTPK